MRDKITQPLRLLIVLMMFVISLGLQAIQVQAVAAVPQVSYRNHVQNVGCQGYVKDGAMSGTSGRSLRLEGINIRISGMNGGIEYQTHVQSIGWQAWKKNDQMSGTSGRGLRLEGIRIRLTGEISKYYDVYYRTHVQSVGWQDWQVNGGMSGTSGRSLRLEGIQIKLEPKPQTKTGDRLTYSTHIQNYGWQQAAGEGQSSGSWGKALRLEAIKINVAPELKSQIEYTTHVQRIGWRPYVKAGQMSGTSGKALRLEGIKIRWQQNAPAAEQYDIVYRTHIEGIGWQNWVKNDAMSGTTGQSKRLEAIEIKLVDKIPVSQVTATVNKSTLTVGETAHITATVSPSNAFNKAVTYSSSDTAVATVDSTDKVTAKKAGTAVLIVKTADGGKTATIKITVTAPVVTVPVTGVSLTSSATTLDVGKTAQLTATVSPSNATNKAVAYSSSDTAVATVDSTGKVTAKKAGTATLTVKKADVSKTATIKIIVTDPVATIPVTGVSLTSSATTLDVGKTAQLTATVSPSNATNKAVAYSSSDTAVATVDSTGKVTAKKAGTATLTVKTADGGKTAISNIIVTSSETSKKIELTYSVANGEACVTGFIEVVKPVIEGDPLDLVIPTSTIINGVTYPVTTIGEKAFLNRAAIATDDTPRYVIANLMIPDSIRTIGDYSFGGNYYLTHLTIPKGVTTIGEGAFELCRRLGSVIIPSSVMTIGDHAFHFCSALTTVTIPNPNTSWSDAFDSNVIVNQPTS